MIFYNKIFNLLIETPRYNEHSLHLRKLKTIHYVSTMKYWSRKLGSGQLGSVNLR